MSKLEQMPMAVNTRALLAAALACCLFALPSPSSSEPAALETKQLTVGVLPIAGHTPVFAARELGYFEQEGLKVDIMFSDGGATLLPLVVQGQIQIGNVPVSTALQARSRNLDVVMIGPGTLYQKRPTAGTIVKAGSNIQRLSDLAGKKIAVNVINSANWLYNRALLEKAGVDVKTVTYVELPFPNMVDAVVFGHVDAASITQPFLFFGLSAGKVNVLGYDLFDVQPGVQISGFAVSRRWSRSNPNTLAAYARAVAKAVDYLTANEKEAVDLEVKFTKTKPEVILAGPPAWTNELSVENVETQMQLMVKHGLLPKPINVQELIWTP